MNHPSILSLLTYASIGSIKANSKGTTGMRTTLITRNTLEFQRRPTGIFIIENPKLKSLLTYNGCTLVQSCELELEQTAWLVMVYACCVVVAEFAKEYEIIF